MEKISVGRGMLTDGAVWLGDEGGMARLRVPVTGGGLDRRFLPRNVRQRRLCGIGFLETGKTDRSGNKGADGRRLPHKSLRTALGEGNRKYLGGGGWNGRMGSQAGRNLCAGIFRGRDCRTGVPNIRRKTMLSRCRTDR